MEQAELERKIPAEKFYREVYENGCIRDVPFEESVHQWKTPTEDGSMGYSLAQCYSFIENGLLADGAKLLKGALGTPIDINSLRITIIQSGGQQGIFRVDCSVRKEGFAVRKEGFALVVGISRDPSMNDFVAYDHRTITELRKREAAAHGMDCDDPAFANISTFPRHFGEYERDGVYFYLAEFLDGYKELNLFNIGGKNILSLNGFNQGEYPCDFEEAASRNLLVNIAVQQVSTSLRCGLVLAPSFRAGDYVYSPEKNHSILHCLRQAGGTESGFWSRVHENSEHTLDPQVELVTYQLLQLLFWKESNLKRASSNPSFSDFFVFSTFDFSSFAFILFKELPLTPEQWEQVIMFIDCWREGAADFLKQYDPEEIRVFEKRMEEMADGLRNLMEM